MKEEAEAAVETAKSILQDLVVVVSLVRTLTDSFGSASDLYRKLKQKSRSKTSDDEDERERRSRRPHQGRRDSHGDHERGYRRHLSWGDSKGKDYSDSDEELICTSSMQVRAEYDRGYRRLGEPFARGDLMTQTQLQSQIIQLQQTLLNIQQDLMQGTYISPSSSHSHIVRLTRSARSARAASIQALNKQYQRMLPPLAPNLPEPQVPGAFPLPLIEHREDLHTIRRRKSKTRKRSSSSSSDSSSTSEKMRPTPKPKPGPNANKLFCVYATDLQRDTKLPLTDNYKASGDNMCPFCHSHIATKPGKAWEIVADDNKNFDNYTKTLSRTFLVKNRFVIKCHREIGGFACALCARFKVSDTLCRGIDALMDHLWREHTSEELGKDEDIVEC